MRSATDFSVLAFANRPYADRDKCWGCGLEPDFLKYGTNPMCYWCEELANVMLQHDSFWAGWDPHGLIDRSSGDSASASGAHVQYE